MQSLAESLSDNWMRKTPLKGDKNVWWKVFPLLCDTLFNSYKDRIYVVFLYIYQVR